MKIYKSILLTALILLVSLQVQAGGAVIVHPSNASALDTGVISKIFLGKQKSFPSGESVVPVDLKDGSGTKSAFTSSILNKSASQMKAYWAKLLFSGKGTPPKVAENDAEVIALVAKNPSIIGYVDAASVDGSVKVVHQF